VNSKDNFLLVFGGAFENEMLKTEDTNKAFFESFFSDETFRARAHRRCRRGIPPPQQR